VYAIDVGTASSQAIRQDPRVVVLERENVRTSTSRSCPSVRPRGVDVSFISLTLVLPRSPSCFGRHPGKPCGVVKPQFEVGRDNFGKGGVVRERGPRRGAATISGVGRVERFDAGDDVESPITGPRRQRRNTCSAFLLDRDLPSLM